MKDLAKLLFKKDKPVIREFVYPSADGPGDAPYLWDAYQKGLLKNMPDNATIEEFLDMIVDLQHKIDEFWLIEDRVKGEMKPVILLFCGNDGWQLEPHVIAYDYASSRNVLRAFVAFLKKSKYRDDIGSVVIRASKSARNIFARIEKMGLIEWVGKIWGGRPDGNEYLYSMRCKAKMTQ